MCLDEATSDFCPSHFIFLQEYIQLMVVANVLVVAMLAITVALVAGIFFLEVDWGGSSSTLLAKVSEFGWQFFYLFVIFCFSNFSMFLLCIIIGVILKKKNDNNNPVHCYSPHHRPCHYNILTISILNIVNIPSLFQMEIVGRFCYVFSRTFFRLKWHVLLASCFC